MRTRSTSKARRLIALVFLLCFVMVALLSGAYVLTHAHHHHDLLAVNEECVVCTHIHSIEDMLRQLVAAAGGLPTVFLGLLAAIALLCSASAFKYQTPIKLKTRLNN